MAKAKQRFLLPSSRSACNLSGSDQRTGTSDTWGQIQKRVAELADELHLCVEEVEIRNWSHPLSRKDEQGLRHHATGQSSSTLDFPPGRIQRGSQGRVPRGILQGNKQSMGRTHLKRQAWCALKCPVTPRHPPLPPLCLRPRRDWVVGEEQGLGMGQRLYKEVCDLGQGHLGEVHLVRCYATWRLYACKTILKDSLLNKRQVEEVKTEILVMAEMQLKGSLTSGPNCGPFLVRLHEVLDDADAVHLVMDYCEGGDLLHHVVHEGCLSEAECATMLLQVLTGLSDLHRMGLVHRDIKPENILLTRKRELKSASSGLPVIAPSFSSLDIPRLLSTRMASKHQPCFVLADFGSCARLEAGQSAQGLVGSPKYMAPEIVEGKEYGFQVDVWSLGVVLYACLCGRQPFVGMKREDVLKAVCQSTPDLSSFPWPRVSREAKGLVKAMLHKDADVRITIPEIMGHPWLARFPAAGGLAPGKGCRGGSREHVPRAMSLPCH